MKQHRNWVQTPFALRSYRRTPRHEPRGSPRRLHALVKWRWVVTLPLQIFGLKPCTLGDPGEHARTDLFGVVEGKDEVRPAEAREDAMGAILPSDAPADAQERRKDSSALVLG